VIPRPIADRLGLRRDQVGQFVGLFAQAWLLGVAMIAFYSTANAHFLYVWTSAHVPWTYLAAAAIVTAFGWSFSAAELAFGLRAVAVGTLVALAGSVAVQWVGLLRAPTDAALTFLGPVWFRVLWTLGNLALWSQANALLDLRQSRRLLPLLTLGVVLGVLSYGVFNDAIVGLLGTVHLLALVTLMLGGAAAVATVTARGRRVRDTSGGSAPALALPARRFVVALLAYDALATASAYVADFAFMDAVARQYPDPEALAVFFGRYMGGMTLVALVATAALSPWVLRRAGPSGGLLGNPLAMSVGVLGALVGLGLGAPDLLVFSMIVAIKAGNEASVTAFTGPSVRTLVRALPATHQVRALTWYDGVVGPLTTGVAGIGLLLVARYGGSGTTALVATAGLVLGTVGAALVVARAYPVLLRDTLAPRFQSDTVLAAPAESLANVDANAALLALRVGRFSVGEEISAGLIHADARVRAASAQVLTTLGPGPTEVGRLEDLVGAEPDADAQIAMIEALAVSGQGRSVAPFLTHSDPAVTDAALTHLLAHGGERTLPTALAALERLSASEAGVRLARVVGGSRRVGLAAHLESLLSHPDLATRLAAVDAVGAIGAPALAARLPLHDPAMSRAVRDALALAGGARFIADHLHDPIVRPLAISVASRSPGAHATDLLVRAAAYPDVRTRAVVALSQPSAVPPEATVFQALLAQERRCADALLAARGLSGLAALAWHRAVRGTLVRSSALLRSVAEADPHAVAVLTGARRGDPAVALELLDTTLPPGRRRWLVPLAEAMLGDGVPRAGDARATAQRLADDPTQSPLLRAALAVTLLPAHDRPEDPLMTLLLESEAPVLPLWERALALHRAAPFQALDDGTLVSFAARCEVAEVAAGTVLVRAGDPSGPVFVVVSGSVRVELRGAQLAELTVGAVFGELDVFSPGPRSADVVAISDTTVLSFSGAVLTELIDDHPPLAWAFLRELTETVRADPAT
jgi:hypothetical protein